MTLSTILPFSSATQPITLWDLLFLRTCNSCIIRTFRVLLPPYLALEDSSIPPVLLPVEQLLASLHTADHLLSALAIHWFAVEQIGTVLQIISVSLHHNIYYQSVETTNFFFFIIPLFYYLQFWMFPSISPSRCLHFPIHLLYCQPVSNSFSLFLASQFTYLVVGTLLWPRGRRMARQ